MRHIGVQGLSASQGQNHRAQCEECVHAIVDKKSDDIDRVQCSHNAGRLGDIHRTDNRKDNKPNNHNRRKKARDTRSPRGLNHEEENKNRNGDGNNESLDTRQRNLKALDRA